MSETPLEDAEGALDRATDLEDEAATSLLRETRRELRAARGDPEIDQDRREELATRLEQRIREIEEREHYDRGPAGAAMDPDEEDAP